MRKQCSFWPAENGLDAWDVDHLIELAAGLPVHEVPLEGIWEVDTTYWTEDADGPMTVRNLIEHIRLVNEVDLSYPIILGANGRVMDGMHRVARAFLDGRDTIKAVRFQVDPEPDYRKCVPSQLPYD